MNWQAQRITPCRFLARPAYAFDYLVCPSALVTVKFLTWPFHSLPHLMASWWVSRAKFLANCATSTSPQEAGWNIPLTTGSFEKKIILPQNGSCVLFAEAPCEGHVFPAVSRPVIGQEPVPRRPLNGASSPARHLTKFPSTKLFATID